MGDLGSDESALVPEAVRGDMEALEAEIAAATGPEPVAPAAPEPDVVVEPGDLAESYSEPLPSEPEIIGPDGQGLQLGGEEPEPVDVLAEKDAEIERINQKLRTLEGKYAAEVPRLHDELRESREQLQALEAQRSDDLTADKVKQMSDQEFMERFGISEENLSYGRDYYEFSIIQNLELRESLKEQIVQPMIEQSASDAERQMRGELREMMPKWESVNKDPGFLKWLGEHGAEEELLDAAGKRSDAKSAVGVFKRYLGASGQTNAQRVSLDSQIAPAPASSDVGVQVRNGQQPGKPIEISAGQVEARLDTLIRGVRSDGTRITETEKIKEKADLDAITGGTSKTHVLVP